MTENEYLFGLLRQEARQRKEEGCAAEAVDGVLQGLSAESSYEKLDEAMERLGALEVGSEFPYDEPTDWADIVKRSPGLQGPAEARPEISEDRMKGAWFARCSGCALGKPLERGPYMNWREGVPGWQGVRIYLKGAGAWPLTDYVPDAGIIEGYDVGCPDSTRGKIRFMEPDDDIRYTVLGLKVLEEKGKDFSTYDVAHAWWNTLPIGQTFTAERQAFRNMARVLDLGEFDQRLPWIRGHHNPFREWIGAQIRADGWAYGAAGRPALAADFGYRDAALSHVKNGIYGEMLWAAAIAAAFNTGDPVEAVEHSLAFIPQRSRLAEDVRTGLDLGSTTPDLDELHDELWKRFRHYDGVHTNNNAALVAAAIAWGRDDFEKTTVAAVTGGWDTDCNGATAGSVWGAAYGYEAVPAHWKDQLNDTLYGLIPGFHPISINECAERSLAVARSFD